MGGGNAQKSAKSRERNMAKAAAAGKGSTLESKAKAMNIKCKVCMALFLSTTNEAGLKQHAENKHPKKEFSECFDM